jgi:hypothetical protein
VSHRIVDTPVGTTSHIGAPTKTQYRVDTAPANDDLVLTVVSESLCDRIPVQLVNRKRETLRGNEVVETEDQGRAQIVGEPTEAVPCNKRFAPRTRVTLVVGGNAFEVGVTNADGRLALNLSRLLEQGLREGSIPREAEVLLRPEGEVDNVVAGKISLAQLRRHEETVRKLYDELAAILNRSGENAPAADIQRSYELYERLRLLAPHDPRVKAVAARFWELFYGRKREEARADLGKDLAALDKARALLKDVGDAAIPLFMRVAASDGRVDAEAIEWSRWQIASAVRQHRSVCTSNFSYQKLADYGFGPAAELSGYYLRFVEGRGFDASMRTLCTRVSGW